MDAIRAESKVEVKSEDAASNLVDLDDMFQASSQSDIVACDDDDKSCGALAAAVISPSQADAANATARLARSRLASAGLFRSAVTAFSHWEEKPSPQQVR